MSLVPEAAGSDVLCTYSLSFLIAGLIALTYTEFVDQFLLLCVAYPRLWADPQGPRRPPARARAGGPPAAGLPGAVGLIPLATGIALTIGLVVVRPEQRALPGYQTFLMVVLVLIGVGMIGSWGATLITGHLGKAIIALTGAERR